jgi:hypothetical protein
MRAPQGSLLSIDTGSSRQRRRCCMHKIENKEHHVERGQVLIRCYRSKDTERKTVIKIQLLTI